MNGMVDFILVLGSLVVALLVGGRGAASLTVS